MSHCLPPNSRAKVTLVGAGPGDPDLLTLKAVKAIQSASVLLVDDLVHPDVLKHADKNVRIIHVGKRGGCRSTPQAFIEKLMAQEALAGETVVRLKGGDPMLFGRADEEIQALKDAGIELAVVPGITAALAGAASIQQSLTLRGISRSVAFVTLAQANHSTKNSPSNQPISNPNADTLVYYMGRKDAAKIAKQLIIQSAQGGIHSEHSPVLILEAVSTVRERLWTSNLAELADGKADHWFDSSSPALIMVGEALRGKSTKVQNVSDSECSDPKIYNSLQDSRILANGRRRA